MKSKNELFLEAVDYLIDKGLAVNQGDVALKAGLGPNLISRVRGGYVKSVSDDSIRALALRFNLSMDFFRGRSDHITRYDQTSANLDRELDEAKKLLNKELLPPSPQPEIPGFAQRLFDEAVRMQTRNELLERQCESLIAELRDTKSKNEDFLSELRKSKEDNDALAAKLRISYEQNEALISELRETRKENRALTEKLEAAIDGIEGMKNQLAMMVGTYATPQPPTFAPSLVNDKVFPEGFIRGGHTAITEELIQKAAEILQSKSKRK